MSLGGSTTGAPVGTDRASRESFLSALTGVNVILPNGTDTAAIVVCGVINGVTAIMLAYAWCNYRYRPIRAKNLTWVTLMYVSVLLWFIGNLPANGMVNIVGAWKLCKMWIVWFRMLFCFVFASMAIVRFYALDHVFNRKKPFTTFNSILAFGIVIVLNGTYSLVTQLISDDLTAGYYSEMQVCNATPGFCISAVGLQWALWLGVGVLIFRLRNIQSSFNEFYESIAVFAVIIALLIESTVINVHYPYYILMQSKRISQTVMDTLCSNLVIWLIMGYPVFMSIFRRREYERRWLDKLAYDSQKVVVTEGGSSGGTRGDKTRLGSRLSTEPPFGDSDLAVPGFAMVHDELFLREDMDLHYAMLNSPSLFDATLVHTTPHERRMI
ncbi:hypothetical protein H4R18_004272 [Coemansia javaensis]|uniref:Uncharacterized protein n=1 Tax=Coemansia javaensis TaxID=2761396 RepID=A0A9W8LHC6_9FUNG|nr:hypothetical protein H4R18_004272 [Coemansia javaensis]